MGPAARVEASQKEHVCSLLMTSGVPTFPGEREMTLPILSFLNKVPQGDLSFRYPQDPLRERLGSLGLTLEPLQFANLLVFTFKEEFLIKIPIQDPCVIFRCIFLNSFIFSFFLLVCVRQFVLIRCKNHSWANYVIDKQFTK